jgi:serine/threonine protein kinase
MEQTTFLGHYRISKDADGAGQEISRSGAAINYKAIDTRTDDAVALQLIPTVSVDPAAREQFEEQARNAQKLDHINIARVLAVGVERDYVVVASEYVDGETVDSWIVEHGPMSADAVLRIGLQVDRALAAAAFHGLTHRAIQPSNIMIVPGQTADGGWPFIKLLNFGLAGLETYSNGAKSREVASTMAPQFASPEQLLNRPLDFRSEIYSLGATMCFLLTGAVPLAVGGMKARLRARRLPELRRAPKALRNLLVHMLRENPENRPQDPVAFEGEIRDCLTKVERRQAIGHKLGISLAAVIPRKPRSTMAAASPARQVLRGALAFVALLLVGAVLGALLLPEGSIPFLRSSAESKTIGVPVGVPDSSPRIAQNKPASPPAPAMNEAANSAAVAAAMQNASRSDEPAPASNTSPLSVENATPNTSTQIAANRNSEPEPPAQGPDDESANEEARAQTNAASQTESAVASGDVAAPSSKSADDNRTERPATSAKKKSSTASTRRSTSTRSRVAQATPDQSDEPGPRLGRGSVRAQFVGMTPDGRVILRLPSGRTVIATPRSEGSRPHRRVRIERRPIDEPSAPYQPFNPDYPFGD